MDMSDMDNIARESSASSGSSGVMGTDSLFTGADNSGSGSTPSSPEPFSSGDRHTIGDVVSTLREEFPSLSVSKVRYLERRRLLNLERTEGGYRLFTQEDIDLLRTILSLQENEYLPLEIIKQRIDRGIILPSSSQSSGDMLTHSGHKFDEKVSGRIKAYTKEELCEELEAEPRFIEELISVGIIGHGDGGVGLRLDSKDLEIARIAIEMSGYGIQPRHLRGIVAAVEREVAMFKQVLNPELRSGDDQRISKAMESARYLASVDTRLKELIISGSVESFDPR